VSNWQLSEATAEDADTIAGLVHTAFEEYRARLDPPSGAHAETAATVREKMKSAAVVLACAAGEPVGCVFYERQEGRLHLFRLAVLPAHRRRGLGRALIEHVEGRARAGGLGRVRLGVRTALGRQRAYYERLGYRPVGSGSHPGHAGPTYLVLQKDLAAG
jgi:ribosomal protein S18 acetylase RimI-like enzyme